MHPQSREAADAGIAASETAIENLAHAAFAFWIPRFEPLVLPGLTADATDQQAPNAAAVGSVQSTQWWDLALDQIIIYGLGLIFGQEYLAAFTALGGDPEELRSLVNVPRIHGRSTTQPPLPTWAHGEVEQADIARQVQRIVGKPFEQKHTAMARIDTDVAEMPTVRAFQHNYLAQVRNRMTDIPDSVFKDISGVLNKGLEAGESPVDMRNAVGAFLDQSDPSWMQRAVLIARTETCGAQSMASLNAAQAREQTTQIGLTKTWGATHDGRTRRTHIEADGQKVPLDGKFRVGVSHMDAPGDPDAPADEVCNCRCRLYVLAPEEAIPARQDSRLAASLATEQEDFAMPPTAPNSYRSFTGTLALLNTATDDGRKILSGNLSTREMPIPLMWQRQTQPGHMESYTVGVIENAGIVGDKWQGDGYFLNTPEADEAVAQAQHGITGPSVDLGDVTVELQDENGKPISFDDLWDLPFDAKIMEVITQAKLLGATLVAKPAFGGTSVTVGGMVERGGVAVDALAGLVASMERATVFERTVHDAVLFANPNFTRPTQRVYDPATGRVMGHLAQWHVCHTGIQKRCQMAPHSPSDYAFFKQHNLETTRGNLKVGALSVSKSTAQGGHAPSGLSIGSVMAHYDNTCTAWAMVNVGEDEHGIWFSGILNPLADAAVWEAGLAAPLSGDWRTVAGQYDLMAAVAINTPGYPVLTASIAEDAPSMLVASAFAPCPEEPASGLTVKDAVKIAVREALEEQERTAAAAVIISQQELLNARREARILIEGMR